MLKLPGLLEAVRSGTVALLNGHLDVRAITDGAADWLVAPGLSDHAGVLRAITLAEGASG